MSLWDEYFNFCRIRKTAKVSDQINLSGIKWFWPINLLPILIYSFDNPDMDIIKPDIPDVENYYQIIRDREIDFAKQKTYIPLIRFPENQEMANRILDQFYQLESGETIRDRNSYHLFISEMVDNIYQHSEFSQAFLMAQRYPKKEFFEICLLDNGISIPGSYEKFGYHLKNDMEALDMAINGVSTKEDEERGYGLGTILKMFNEGLKSEFLLISRKAALHIEKENIFYKLGPDTSFSGTLISVRVPYNNVGVNIYDYLE